MTSRGKKTLSAMWGASGLPWFNGLEDNGVQILPVPSDRGQVLTIPGQVR